MSSEPLPVLVQLSLVVLISSLTTRPLRVQVVDPVQVPNGDSLAQIPSLQDVSATPPSPLPPLIREKEHGKKTACIFPCSTTPFEA